LKFSKKGKVPWIELNGEEMADSQFCIEYLSKKLNVNLNDHLNEQDQALSRAFMKMTEESLVWCMALQRFVIDPQPEYLGFSKFMSFYAGN
jgi:hypothetical protein